MATSSTKGRDELRGTTGTYVNLADSILEYAVPEPGRLAHADWLKDEPNDTYHAITWKVADLDRAERHSWPTVSHPDALGRHARH